MGDSTEVRRVGRVQIFGLFSELLQIRMRPKPSRWMPDAQAPYLPK